jgi:Amt family ammonium transporter
LAGATMVGPRIGKFQGGKINAIPGHNIPLAAMGVFILWLGWFGFNPGSTNIVNPDSGSMASFAKIAITTNLSGCCGALGAMLVAWIVFKKPDTSFVLNGALAGLVAITAGCANMDPEFAALTGLLAGMLVVGSCIFFDRIGVDDPVGAVSVHGVCGAFGTLAVGVVGTGNVSFLPQLIGVAMAFAWAFPVSLGIFFLIKVTIGLRASPQEEIDGLDVHEHGLSAYPPVFVADPTSISVSSSPPSKPSGGRPIVQPAMEGA